MELVVLNVAYPFAPVGPAVLGDAELMVTQLDAALTHAGHESFVMACEGSATEGILLATPRPAAAFDEKERHHILEQYRFTLRTFLEKWPIDLIHMHGADFLEYLPPAGVPVLVTLHLPINQYPERIFRLDRPQTFLQCVSAAQRAACPPCVNLLAELAGTENIQHNDALPAARSIDEMIALSDVNRPFANPLDVGKYLSLYERLVTDARALQTAQPDYGQPKFEHSMAA